MENKKETFQLNNGVCIPCLGFGTYKAAKNESVNVINLAIQSGYRYFDTASFYGTEACLGEAIRKSGIPREEFMVVTKAWKDEMGYEETKKAFERSLNRLQMDYVDGYLIHWPKPAAEYENWKELDLDTWRAMEELHKDGKTRFIGTSNFLPHHLENIVANGTIIPAVNQLEFHPGYAQEAARIYCVEKGIQLQAWSPIGRGRVFGDELVQKLSEKYQATPAQICLKYALQKRVMPLPKASSPNRLKENQDLFKFEITQEDMYQLDTMPQAGWSGEHPDRERVAEQNS